MTHRLQGLAAKVSHEAWNAGCTLRTLFVLGLGLGLGMALAAVPRAAEARDLAPYAAQAGIDLTAAAARAWEPDAILVYLENDERVDTTGVADRWGYLYYSPSRETSRIYSVRDGKILVAENLVMKFDAPPLSAGWIDSRAAVAVAESEVGLNYRHENRGHLSTMLLMRGAFHGGEPDQTTWTLIYTSRQAAPLFVVVDALEGKVRRTWRG